MTLKSPNYRDGEEMSGGRGGPAGEGGGGAALQGWQEGDVVMGRSTS